MYLLKLLVLPLTSELPLATLLLMLILMLATLLNSSQLLPLHLVQLLGGSGIRGSIRPLTSNKASKCSSSPDPAENVHMIKYNNKIKMYD